VKRPRPAGILLALGVAVVAAVCIRLGFWQLDRLEQRRQFNEQTIAALSLPALPLDRSGIAAIYLDPAGHTYRKATAEGSFDYDGEILLRGRSHDGSPGVHVITPFRLDDDGLILVNRGWLPAPDAATVDPRPYRVSGRVRVTGTLQVVPDDPEGGTPLTVDVDGYPVDTYRRIDRAAIGARLGDPVPPLYLQAGLESAPDGLPIPVPPPPLDEGSHLGYAIQWFSFAAIAVFGFLFVVLTRTRRDSAT
jgi:surfeit locus 1 family protein